ncbi:hypothetical protein BH24BAC1_BH24BAC1_33850 [soil metagenome]
MFYERSKINNQLTGMGLSQKVTRYVFISPTEGFTPYNRKKGSRMTLILRKS